jgi:hypothetical protein
VRFWHPSNLETLSHIYAATSTRCRLRTARPATVPAGGTLSTSRSRPGLTGLVDLTDGALDAMVRTFGWRRARHGSGLKG